MLVKDVMSSHPQFVAADAPIRQAAERMRASDARILVVHTGGRIAGVVTDRDLALGPAERSQPYDTSAVRDVMTPEAHAVRSCSSISAAAEAMKEKSIWHLLVIDDSVHHVVGVLSLADLAARQATRALACQVLGHLAGHPRRRGTSTGVA